MKVVSASRAPGSNIGGRFTVSTDYQSQFVHEPLEASTGCTRLLELPPGSNKIHCILSSVALPIRESCYALSDEWGTQGEVVSIFINDRPFFVQKNLHHFLSILRLQRSKELPINLWCYVICIILSDNTAKCNPLRDMHVIFRNSSILAWLGNDTEHAGEAINIANDWFQEPEPRDGLYNQRKDRVRESNDAQGLVYSFFRAPTVPYILKAIEQIYRRTYFQRS